MWRPELHGDGPLAFSSLYDRVDVDDSGQFNYHLDKLAGHFVPNTDHGYALARPRRRVVESVLVGPVRVRHDWSGRRSTTPANTAARRCRRVAHRERRRYFLSVVTLLENP